MKELLTNKLFLIGIGVVVLIACAAVAYTAFPAAREELSGVKGGGVQHAVVLSKEGFQPPVLTIKKGDTVTFSTNLGIQYWPASNQHPIHADYPAFDPKRPVNPGEEWSFTFDRVGTWSYHDHLNSPIRGTIIVTE
jgi:plastocyanin